MRRISGRGGPGPGRGNDRLLDDSGTSAVELIIALVALIFLGIILLPFGRCAWEKARVSGRLTELRQARDMVEKYIDQHGAAPLSLQTAYDAFEPGLHRPQLLFYCATDSNRLDAAENSQCDEADPDNPPGVSPPPEVAGAFYILATDRPLAPRCHSIDLAWVTCCKRVPEIVRLVEARGSVAP